MLFFNSLVSVCVDDCFAGYFDIDCVAVDYLLYLVGQYLAVISVVLADYFDLLNVKVTQPPQTAFLTSY